MMLSALLRWRRCACEMCTHVAVTSLCCTMDTSTAGATCRDECVCLRACSPACVTDVSMPIQRASHARVCGKKPGFESDLRTMQSVRVRTEASPAGDGGTPEHCLGRAESLQAHRAELSILTGAASSGSHTVSPRPSESRAAAQQSDTVATKKTPFGSSSQVRLWI